MNNCLKFLWIISLYGIIFFTFTSITFVTGPQYYEFNINDEVRNSNIILVFLYLIMFIILSIKWRRDKNIQSDDDNNVELRPLREMDEHHPDSIQIQ